MKHHEMYWPQDRNGMRLLHFVSPHVRMVHRPCPGVREHGRMQNERLQMEIQLTCCVREKSAGLSLTPAPPCRYLPAFQPIRTDWRLVRALLRQKSQLLSCMEGTRQVTGVVLALKVKG